MFFRTRRRFADTDRARTVAPAPDAFLGYGAMLPILAGAVATHALPRAVRGPVATATALWGGAILCFLGGVRRGLSFDDPGGARDAERATMLTHFAFGLAGLALPGRTPRLATLAAGYTALGLLDHTAARDREAPRYFAHLRPIQASVAAFSLLSLLRVDS